MALLSQSVLAALAAVEPEKPRDFSPLPAGTYTLRVVRSEQRPPKSGKGKLIALDFEVIGPQFAGRHVFGYLNIQNESQTAEQIGLSQLKALVLSGGIPVEALKDDQQLVGITTEARVTIKPADDQHPASNRVDTFKPAGGAPAAFAPRPADYRERMFAPRPADYRERMAEEAPEPTPTAQSWFQ